MDGALVGRQLGNRSRPPRPHRAPVGQEEKIRPPASRRVVEETPWMVARIGRVGGEHIKGRLLHGPMEAGVCAFVCVGGGFAEDDHRRR